MTIYRPRRAFIESRESLAPINWRRGFFRIWLLLSAAWIMGWALYLILFALQDGFAKIGDFLMIPVVFFGPPVAIFLLGIATAWAFRGFQTDEKEPERANEPSDADPQPLR
jgi:hypothetical protein